MIAPSIRANEFKTERTKYLQNYLRWFERIELAKASSRVCLAAAIDERCIRFSN